MNSAEVKAGYQTERLNDKNLDDLGKLYTAVYNKKAPANYFPLKYNTTFTGIRHTGFIAYDEQHQPVAFYGVIPCFLLFRDKVVLAAQSADTMTHPAHRNKGLFVQLGGQTFELCRSVGIKLLFGFPNQNSLHGFVNKLGWLSPERMDCFIIETGANWWQRAFRKLDVFKTWHAKYQQQLINQYAIDQKGIENSGLNDGCAGVYRDYHYRKYKNYTNTHVIKIDNAELWIKINHELLIGDILVEPANSDLVIDKLKSFARKLGIKEIHFHSSPGTTLHKLFSGRFSVILSFPVIFKDLDGGLAIGNIKFTSADIDTF